MGLDMYVFATKEGLPAPVDFPAPEAVQLHQWRKHPNLHGWMEELYLAKGGRQASFNCVNVQLTADDLQELEADIKASNLPSTEGFFFGVSDGTELEAAWPRTCYEDLVFEPHCQALGLPIEMSGRRLNYKVPFWPRFRSRH